MKKTVLIALITFILGILIALWGIKSLEKKSMNEDSRVIAYQIQKMNKMVVAEQSLAEIYTHTSKKSLPGLGSIYTSDKKVTMMINAKVQASYDLTKMEVELDSVNKKIVIASIPPVDLKVYPDVDFFDMDQSIFNKFEKNELNEIKNRGIAQVEKKIDREKIKKEAHQQLIQNLSDIYQIAKIYGWEIEDRTTYANELKQLFD
ncbi:DUF4230 domain-containing protein [Faecalibacter sp. LW9]|uniref:DUF4230 domain-containing protein n=1 Tax=Faecalibacter sp. LW9 TaxID=3103144 RepID=UPI002B0007E5|nr:DUF4230 domain-containing protein [Faecalibacter sp. LW9]